MIYSTPEVRVISVTYRIPFEAAHRLVNHTGKCRFLHGHSYVARVTICRRASPFNDHTQVNNAGMVIDFSAIKELVKRWVDDNWDHNILLNTQDALYQVCIRQEDLAGEIFKGRTPYWFYEQDPTVEVIAMTLKKKAQELLDPGYPVEVTEVSISETENGSACCTS